MKRQAQSEGEEEVPVHAVRQMPTDASADAREPGAAVAGGPLRAGEAGVLRGHGAPERQLQCQHDREGPEPRGGRKRRVPRRRGLRRRPRRQSDEQEARVEGVAGEQMGRDGPGRQLEDHGEPPQHDLHREEDGGEGEPAAGARSQGRSTEPDREERAKDQSDASGEKAVAPLEGHLKIHLGDPCAEALRPIGTGETGIVGSDQGAQHDEAAGRADQRDHRAHEGSGDGRVITRRGRGRVVLGGGHRAQ